MAPTLMLPPHPGPSPTAESLMVSPPRQLLATALL